MASRLSDRDAPCQRPTILPSPDEMNDRLEKIFAAIVPGQAEIVSRVVRSSNPADVGKTISGPKIYRLYLVNEGELNIASIGLYSGGFASEDDEVVELERSNELHGAVDSNSALLLRELPFGMLDFVLWYYVKLTFADDTQLIAKFDIPKDYGLREQNRRFITALAEDAYVFEVKPFQTPSA